MSRFRTSLTNIQKGDTVKLRGDSVVTTRKDNPKMGSKYECSGVVTAITATDVVCVAWENGTNNAYRGRDLISCGGEYNSIW